MAFLHDPFQSPKRHSLIRRIRVLPPLLISIWPCCLPGNPPVTISGPLEHSGWGQGLLNWVPQASVLPEGPEPVCLISQGGAPGDNVTPREQSQLHPHPAGLKSHSIKSDLAKRLFFVLFRATVGIFCVSRRYPKLDSFPPPPPLSVFEMKILFFLLSFFPDSSPHLSEGCT